MGDPGNHNMSGVAVKFKHTAQGFGDFYSRQQLLNACVLHARQINDHAGRSCPHGPEAKNNWGTIAS